MRKLVKILYVCIGLAALLLGIVGIVLPLLPTTPLLLLAAFCFVRGSERFDRWFKGIALYKKHVETFMREKAMTLKQKLTILLFADAMIVVAFVLADRWMIRAALIAIVAYKYYYFFTKIKTIKKADRQEGGFP